MILALWSVVLHPGALFLAFTGRLCGYVGLKVVGMVLGSACRRHDTE